MTTSQVLGRGTFGQVRREGNTAIKRFEKPSHIIQEAIVTIYFRDSPYIVKCLGYDFDKLELTTELHDISLRDALLKYSFTTKEKHKIYRDILCGLTHIHSRNVIHADLKPSNILLNFSPFGAVICDLGLSSTDRYSKVHQTARAYRLPDSLIKDDNGAYHDLYSLAIVGIELFGNIKLTEQVNPKYLLRTIDEISPEINDKKLCRTLRRIIRRRSGYDTARSILNYYYNEDTFLPIPSLPSVDDVISEEDSKYLRKDTYYLCDTMKIRRSKRCYYVLMDRFNNRNYEPVRPEEYPLYIVTMGIINSALFGEPGFNYRRAIAASGRRWKKADINRALCDIISKYDLINFLMLQ